jgi:predicted ATPase
VVILGEPGAGRSNLLEGLARVLDADASRAATPALAVRRFDRGSGHVGLGYAVCPVWTAWVGKRFWRSELRLEKPDNTVSIRPRQARRKAFGAVLRQSLAGI